MIRNAFFANRNTSGSCAGLRTFVDVFPFLSFVAFKNFFPIHANTSFSKVRGVAVNLQADHLMSRISVSDIPAYRPFIRRMSVSDKLTLPIIITNKWAIAMAVSQARHSRT